MPEKPTKFLLFTLINLILSLSLGFISWTTGLGDGSASFLLGVGVFIGGLGFYMGRSWPTSYFNSKKYSSAATQNKNSALLISSPQVKPVDADIELMNFVHMMLNQSPTGFLLLDDHQRIVFANPEAAKLFGHINTQELIGQNIVGFIRHTSLLQILEKVKEPPQRIFEIEFSLAIPTTRYWHITLQRLRMPFTPDFITVVSLRDQTSLKKIIQENRDFVANASHQLQTPLAIIKSLVETLEAHFSTDNQQQNQFLGLLTQQTQRMNELVDGLLLLAKVERHKERLAYQPVSTLQLLQNVVRNLQPLMQKTNLQLQIAGNMPPLSFVPNNLTWLPSTENLPDLLGDESQLYVVFENLLENAIRYSRPNQKVWIGLTLSLIQSAEIEPRLKIAIIDEGIGILPDHLPRLGERFYRSNEPYYPAGTGLGLAIVQQVLQSHRGQLSIYSQPQQGSCFLVSLPIAKTLAPAS